MTDDQRPEPLEPIPVSEPPTDPAASAVEPPSAPPSTAEPPTVEAPAATAAAPPPPPPRRTHVTVPVWALAAVGGVFLLAFGFLLGWVLAPGDDDDSATNPAGSAQELPFGGNFSPFAPDDDNGNNGNGGRFGFDENAAYLGVVVQDSSEPDGAEIVRVASDGPAEDANLEDGDVITELDGDGVEDAADLTERIRDHEAGDTVTIGYERDGDEHTVEVELDERPALGDLVPPTTRPSPTS